MSMADLTTGATKLRLATQTLEIAWKETREHWNDVASRRFQQLYLEPITPRVKMTLEAVNRLSEVAATVRRELEE
jgi:hypothetical protein